MGGLFYNTPTNKACTDALKPAAAGSQPELDTAEKKEASDYLESLDAAKKDLENIETLFNSTSDPDLIEYAIYEQYAIRLKLSYLIKKAKENNIKSANYISLNADV